ncbi:unnamed protein product, partial [Amoebophrya sp. A120]|eukprot:GSA120T00009269001.1
MIKRDDKDILNAVPSAPTILVNGSEYHTTQQQEDDVKDNSVVVNVGDSSDGNPTTFSNMQLNKNTKSLSSDLKTHVETASVRSKNTLLSAPQSGSGTTAGNTNSDANKFSTSTTSNRLSAITNRSSMVSVTSTTLGRLENLVTTFLGSMNFGTQRRDSGNRKSSRFGKNGAALDCVLEDDSYGEPRQIIPGLERRNELEDAGLAAAPLKENLDRQDEDFLAGTTNPSSGNKQTNAKPNIHARQSAALHRSYKATRQSSWLALLPQTRSWVKMKFDNSWQRSTTLSQDFDLPEGLQNNGVGDRSNKSSPRDDGSGSRSGRSFGFFSRATRKDRDSF